LRTRAIPERLRGAFTTRRYTNPRLPIPNSTSSDGIKITGNERSSWVCFRLLKEAADDVRYRKRFQLLFGALLSVVGKAMRNELSKQDEFVHILSSVADKVKAAKDREVSFLCCVLLC